MHGYFDGEPTLNFWKIQAVYVAHSALFSIEWAAKFGEEDIANMTRICHKAFHDYDNFNLLIPKNGTLKIKISLYRDNLPSKLGFSALAWKDMRIHLHYAKRIESHSRRRIFKAMHFVKRPSHFSRVQ